MNKMENNKNNNNKNNTTQVIPWSLADYRRQKCEISAILMDLVFVSQLSAAQKILVETHFYELPDLQKITTYTNPT